MKAGPWLLCFWSLVSDFLRSWRTIKDCERSKSKIWGRCSALTNWHLAQIPVAKEFSAFLMRGSLVRVTQNGKIPSELEVALRYDCWHCWHCWYCWHCWHCWHSLKSTPPPVVAVGANLSYAETFMTTRAPTVLINLQILYFLGGGLVIKLHLK